MVKVEMFVTPSCPFCTRAKGLLQKKGVAYEVIDLKENPERKKEMLTRSEGRRTVPQIFIDGKGVGGFDDIAELDSRGELDALLGIDTKS